MKQNNMKWFCIIYDFNHERFIKYNVLNNKETTIKQIKKKVKNKTDFALQLKTLMMYNFWSKCEYEILITLIENEVILQPVIGDPTNKCCAKDILSFDWKNFFQAQKDKYIKYEDGSYKVDVWDQLEFNWQDFVDYCWNFHHKWQRTNRLET